MRKTDKITEGQTQLNVREHYQPLETPMVEQTSSKVFGGGGSPSMYILFGMCHLLGFVFIT